MKKNSIIIHLIVPLLIIIQLFTNFSSSQTIENSSDKKLSGAQNSNFGTRNSSSLITPNLIVNETLSIVNETKSGHDFKILNERLETLSSDKERVVSSSGNEGRVVSSVGERRVVSPDRVVSSDRVVPSSNNEKLVSSSDRDRTVSAENERLVSSSNRRESRQAARQQQSLNNKESTERLQSLILGGKPGVDYPNFVRPPRTKFSCRKMEYGGMFADPETKCQAYHVCYNRRMDTFLCPTGTLFNQAIMACDFWYNVNCDRAPEFYDMNFQLYQPYQPKTTLRPRNNIQPPARPSQPVPTVVAAPTTPTTIFRSFVPSSSTIPPILTSTTRRPGGITRSRALPPPTTSTVGSTSTTSTTTTPTPRTKKATTPRLRSATQRTRPPSRPMAPGIDVDDRDWVFAWLKQGNGTRADKQLLPELLGSSSGGDQPQKVVVEKKMDPQNYPLLSFTELDTNHKTDSAFSFSHDLNPFDSSYGFSVNHNPAKQVTTVSTSSLLPASLLRQVVDGRQSSDKVKRLIPLQESTNHPNPWLFPRDPQVFN